MLTLAFVGGTAPNTGRKVNEWLDDCGRVVARAYAGEGVSWIDWQNIGVFAFSPGSQEVRVWSEPETQREAVVGTFSRMLQPVILQALGWQALHAGAVVGPTGVVAFCGKKGAGKSTLAFGMQQAGWRQFSDDALVLQVDPDRVIACPLPFSPRLRPPSSAHFAHCSFPVCRGSRREDVPLTAIYLLQRDAGPTCARITPMPQARAFSALLAHAYCFDTEDPTHTRGLVNDCLELVARVPVFELKFRPDFRYFPQLIRAVVESAASIDSGNVLPSESRSTVMLP